MNEYEISHFGGGGGTNISVLGGAIVLLAIVLLFVLPRNYVFVSLFIAAFLLPMGQKVVIGGIHLVMYRVVISFCWIKALTSARSESPRPWVSIDRVFLLWALSAAIVFTLLWGPSAIGSRIGFLYDAFALYFFLRYAYRDVDDVERAIKVLALICAVIALCMIAEQFTGQNPFSIVGGVRVADEVRDGHVRAQAAFSHSILAGTFGATMFPLFFALWWKKAQGRGLAILGMLSAITIVFTSHSSTPASALLASIVALGLWPLRRRMRLIRWAIASTLIGLHMVMKGPVWALIGRIDLAGGSASYHRENLINQFIIHFKEWCLIGTQHPALWGYDLQDPANQYVFTGIEGGLITLILFIALITYGFKAVGNARKAAEDDFGMSRFAWGLGAALFAHVVGFFGIMYFDQSIIGWYSLLAMIACLPLAVAVPVPLQSATVKHSERSLVPAVERPRMEWSTRNKLSRPIRSKV